jgi:putative transposase
MEKAFKYRLYPNKKQIELINKTFGCVRFVYNYYLGKRIKLYREQGITLNYNKCSADLTRLKKEKEWLK